MIIGILGGIGAGKSTVAGMLKQLGAQAVDADALAHEALEVPAVRGELTAWLGSTIFDAAGHVDRKALGERVFGDPEKLKKLEGLVHPHVRDRIGERLDEFRRAGARRNGGCENVLALDIPLLVSTPFREACDALVFVHADLAAREERVKRSRGWSARELETRERHQMPVEEKRRLADFVIDNSGNEESTRNQVETCLRELQRRAGTPPSSRASATRGSPGGPVEGEPKA